MTVLEVYRRPENRNTWTDPRQPLPQGLSLIVELAKLQPNAVRIKECADRLHVSSSELHAAIGFFIRQVFLAPGADHYRVLGLNPQADAGRIREHYRKLIGLFHPDRQHGGDEWTEDYSVRINQAYTVLQDPSKRRTYDADLRRRARSDHRWSQPPVRSESVHSTRPLTRRTRRSRLRTVFASPRTAWQSVKSYASMQQRWRRKTIDLYEPNGLRRRLGLISSIAAMGVCLAFVLNTLVSLRLPSLVDAVRSGLHPSMTSPQPANRADPETDMLADLPSLASFPEQLPSNTAAIGTSSDNGPKTALQTDTRQNRSPTLGAPRAVAPHQRASTPPKRPAPAHKTAAPATAKSRQRPRNHTVPTVEDNASALPRPADRHDSTSSPTASTQPRKPGQSRQPPIADILSRPEADRLLARFLQTYESGNITNFMRLFAAQTRTEYREEYAQLFATTKTRRIIFYDFHWQLLGPNGIGEGRFVVTAKHKGKTTPSIIRGRFMLQIRKSRQGVLITELLRTRR